MLDELKVVARNSKDPASFVNAVTGDDSDRVLSVREMLALLLNKDFEDVPSYRALSPLKRLGIHSQLDSVFYMTTGDKEVDLLDLDTQLTDFFKTSVGVGVLTDFFAKESQ